jgi:hypothetical protein
VATTNNWQCGSDLPSLFFQQNIRFGGGLNGGCAGCWVSIDPGSPWENGYNESFNGSLGDELLNGEIFYRPAEVRVLNRPPAQQSGIAITSTGNRDTAISGLRFRPAPFHI